MNTRYDMPQNYYFGGGTDTFLTPLAAVILLVAIVLIVGLPRKWMIVPVVVAGLLLPFDLGILVMGFHFSALRLLVAAGWLRFAVRRDIGVTRVNSLDKAVLAWAFCKAIFFSILWATTSAVTNRLGFLSTTLATYFLVRFLIRDKEDAVGAVRVLAVTMIILAPFMMIEHFTQHNFFSVLGSPPISSIRDGAVRATGPFGHPVVAGTVGAMLLPLFTGLWWQGKRYRTILGLGVLSSIGVTFASSSSTPLMTCAGGVLALLLWPLRTRLRTIRWALVLSLITLHLVMNASVWFLIARMGGAIGGSGYHRAMLVDNFVRHFSEWWLIGTRNNADWGYDMWDVDNAFVGAGVGGGLITFATFIAVLVYAYKRVGKSRRLASKSRKDERFVWAVGASLFANTVGFFGIVYFDQSIVAWYCVLAMVSATATFLVDSKKTPTESRNGRDQAETKTEDASLIPQYSARWA